jgi:multicomponent Na+:H+ antiporter subunit E
VTRLWLRALSRPWRLAWFVALYVADLARANAVVAWEVVTPSMSMRPGIVACPVRSATDAELTVLANLVSFTPGTLALEVAADRSVMYVHALHIGEPDDVRAAVRRLEDRLRWISR